MYLVGLTTQAAVIGAIAAAAIFYQGPIRTGLGLAPPEAAVQAAVVGLDSRMHALAEKVDALAAALGTSTHGPATAAPPSDDGATSDPAPLSASTAFGSTVPSESIAQRIDAVEQLVARVEAKVDDVRDAQLFPSRQPPGATNR